ncbi:MAG: hypothetical protein ACOX2M_06555 [Fastidiosipilaceae bacterium]|jgi:hypothetical protein
MKRRRIIVAVLAMFAFWVSMFNQSTAVQAAEKGAAVKVKVHWQSASDERFTGTLPKEMFAKLKDMSIKLVGVEENQDPVELSFMKNKDGNLIFVSDKKVPSNSEWRLKYSLPEGFSSKAGASISDGVYLGSVNDSAFDDDSDEAMYRPFKVKESDVTVYIAVTAKSEDSAESDAADSTESSSPDSDHSNEVSAPEETTEDLDSEDPAEEVENEPTETEPTETEPTETEPDETVADLPEDKTEPETDDAMTKPSEKVESDNLSNEKEERAEDSEASLKKPSESILKPRPTGSVEPELTEEKFQITLSGAQNALAKVDTNPADGKKPVDQADEHPVSLPDEKTQANVDVPSEDDESQATDDHDDYPKTRIVGAMADVSQVSGEILANARIVKRSSAILPMSDVLALDDENANADEQKVESNDSDLKDESSIESTDEVDPQPEAVLRPVLDSSSQLLSTDKPVTIKENSSFAPGKTTSPALSLDKIDKVISQSNKTMPQVDVVTRFPATGEHERDFTRDVVGIALLLLAGSLIVLSVRRRKIPVDD